MKKIMLAITLLLLLAACQEPRPMVEIVDKAVVYVELAKTPQEQAKGLMHREHLDRNAGMLFLFSREQPLSFWMKNTLMPLDMIFIDEHLQVVDIKHAVPCEKDPCPRYTAKYPAKYVLEVNAGFSEKKDIEIGDKVILP